MIELKCKNCGGKVERDESQVFVSDNAVIVMAGHGFECQHCGSRFEPGTAHEKVTGDTFNLSGDFRGAQVAIGSNIAQAGRGGVAVVASHGGVAIAGNVKGDVVIQ